MPTPTTRLGLSKPLGNETVSRAAYSAVLDEIDAAAAGLAVFNEFRADQGIGARGTADSGVTGYDSYDDYIQGSVWDGSASAPRYRRFTRRVKATPSASYLQLAYQAEGAAEIPLIEISAAGALRPATDSGGSLGEANRRWGAAYLKTLDIGTAVKEYLRIDASGNLSVDAGAFVVDAANNRVGINTTTPTYELDVYGILRGRSHSGIGDVAGVNPNIALKVENTYSGASANVGVHAVARQATQNNASAMAFRAGVVADNVTITNFFALWVDSPTLVGSGAVTNRFFANIAPDYTQPTVGGAGTASPLPSAPKGYVKLVIGGEPVVIPYYNAA